MDLTKFAPWVGILTSILLFVMGLLIAAFVFFLKRELRRFDRLADLPLALQALASGVKQLARWKTVFVHQSAQRYARTNKRLRELHDQIMCLEELVVARTQEPKGSQYGLNNPEEETQEAK